MDIREYISSGRLELYACNALSPREAREVEDMLVRYPELAAELRKIEAAMEDVAGGMAEKPPARAKSTFLDAVAEDLTGDTRARLAVYKWSLAASLALLLVSTFLTVTFYSRWKNSSERLIALQEQQTRLAEQNKVLSGNMESALAVLRNPSSEIITLAGTEGHADSKALVYWDRETGKVVLDQVSLPQHDQEHQYQLWAIHEGTPVNAGIFDVSGESSLTPLEVIGEADAFAITLEPRGGSEAPTLDQMVVIGKI